MKYQSLTSSTQCSKDISKVKVFKKLVKLQGQGHRLKNNGTLSITGNTHLKYQSSITHCLKVISKVKVFKKWVQGQGHRVKNNIKALALVVQKLLARLKFQLGGRTE